MSGRASGGLPGRGRGPRCWERLGACAAAMALGLAAAGAARGLTPAVPKGMQSSGGSTATGNPDSLPVMAPPPPPKATPPTPPASPPTSAPAPAQGSDDPWSGVLFSTSDPWAPGSVPPQARRPVPGMPGAPVTRGALAAPAAPVPPLAPGEKPKPERVEALYRQALVHWAAGKSEIAFHELAALETAVVNDKDAGSAKRLLRAEEKVIDQVAGAELEVLLPIARLHFEVFQLYLNENAKGRTLVENHSRTMVHDLAMRYREQSGSQGAALVASHLLTSLAELLQRGSQHQAAAALYTQAAQLDPHNPVPALRLAVTYEKFEQYQSAVGGLGKVLAIEPKNAEARLRLAINLGRIGKAAEALKVFEGLTAEEGGSWVTPVAFQELARLEERREAFTRAEAVLRAGMVRFPRTVRMRLQLAALLDRQGKIREGRQVIEEIPTLGVGAVEEGARVRSNNT